MKTTVTVLAIVACLHGVTCQFDLFGFGGGGMGGAGQLGAMPGFGNMGGGMAEMLFGAVGGGGGLRGGGGGFGGGGGMGGGGGGVGMAPAPAAPVDPALAREARLTATEEQLGELLSEGAATDPARQRVERMLRQSGGKLTGEAASLNYLISEFQLTTPGSTPPPSNQPTGAPQYNNFPLNGPNNQAAGPHLNGNFPAGHQSMPGMGPAQHPSQRWPGGPADLGGRPQRRGRPGRRRGGNQNNIPTTTALPDWQQWLFNSQTVTPKPPPPPRQPGGGARRGQNRGPPSYNQRPAANGPPQRRRPQSGPRPAGNFNQHGPPPPRNFNQHGPPPTRDLYQQGPPPPRDLYHNAPPPFNQPGQEPQRPFHQQGPPPPRHFNQQGPPPPRPFNNQGPPPPRNLNNQGPPPSRNLNNQGPPPGHYQQGPNNGPAPPAAPQPKPPASKRKSIAVERLKNIQRRIDNLIRSQGVGASTGTSQQLSALKQIRDILSGKNLKGSSGPRSKPQGPQAHTKTGGPPAQSYPPYETNAAAPRPARSAHLETPPYNSVSNQPKPYHVDPHGHGPAAGRGNNNNAHPSVNFSPFVSGQASDPMPPPGSGPAPGQPAGPGPGSVQQQGTMAPPMQGGGKKRGPAVTTVAPKLGDVRMVGTQKFVYTDADGFDTFQWVKATPGPPAEQPPKQPPKQQQHKKQPNKNQNNQQQQNGPPA